MQNAWTVFTIFGQTTQQFCHTGSHPAITSTPIEKDIQCMTDFRKLKGVISPHVGVHNMSHLHKTQNAHPHINERSFSANYEE